MSYLSWNCEGFSRGVFSPSSQPFTPQIFPLSHKSSVARLGSSEVSPFPPSDEGKLAGSVLFLLPRQ